MVFHKISHRKTKTGCTQCKKRHIKCDENKPTCQNCLRYPSDCSFSSPSMPAIKRSTPPAVRALARVQPATPLARSTMLSTKSMLSTSPLNQVAYGNVEFCYEDFELFHQWTVSTGKSLAPNWELQRALVEVVPRLAMEYDYLMHALLALTALHLAHLHPSSSKTWHLKATHHHALCLPAIRTGLQNLNAQTCHALYGAGHLLLKYAFAASQFESDDCDLVFTSTSTFNPASDTSTAHGVISAWVPLARGAFAVYDHSSHWLKDGPWASCTESLVPPLPALSTNPSDAQFARLVPLLQQQQRKQQQQQQYGNTNAPADDSLICQRALALLRTLLALAHDPRQTRMSRKSMAFAWVAGVEGGFWEAVARGVPGALVVLAHYCVMVKEVEGEVEGGFWFMKGVAGRVVGGVRKCLPGEEWVEWIRWPVGVVGVD